MRIRAALFAFALIVIAVTSIHAQENSGPSPDRPGVSTSAEPVGRGVLQLETGVDYARERRAGEESQRRTSVVASLRYGLLDSVELRLDGEPFVALRGAEDATDVGDFILGVKWRFLDGGEGALRPTLAVFPSVKLPTAPEPIGTERPDFTVLGLATCELGRVALDFNAGAAAVAQRDPDGYLVQAQLIAGISGEVVDRLKLLGEIFYFSRAERDGDDLVGATVGAVYALTRNLAIDGAVITTLAGRGPDYRLRAGLTISFGP